MHIRQLILLLTLALSALPATVLAQRDVTTARPLGTVDDRKAVMNRIKQSTDYYWAEASATTADEAFALAVGKLVVDIQAEQNGAEIDSATIVRQAQRLDIPRGANMRVFVYTSKAGITASRPSTASAANGASGTTNSSPSGAATETKPTSVTTETTQQTPAQQMPSTTTVEEGNSATSTASTSIRSLTTTDFDDLISTLNQLKQSGAIEAYGKCTRDNISQTADAYLVIIDVAARQVRAVLTPEQSGQRHNLATGAVDSTANYHRCNGLWVRAK